MTDAELVGWTAVRPSGGSGIGAACAAALAEGGADVALLLLKDGDGAKAVAAGIVGVGRRADTVALDVGVEGEVEDAFGRAGAELGTPDILVSSAGLNMTGMPVADMAADQWEKLIRTDLTGSFLASRRFVRDLGATGRPGAIVNITSIHAFATRAGAADYAAAKGGQANLTRTMALQCAAAGMTVNAIAPDMTLTSMNADAPDDLVDKQRAGRVSRPEKAARLAAVLVSPDASYITARPW